MMRHHQVKVAPPPFLKTVICRILFPPAVSEPARSGHMGHLEHCRAESLRWQGYQQLADMVNSGVTTVDIKGAMLQCVVVSFPHAGRVGADQIT